MSEGSPTRTDPSIARLAEPARAVLRAEVTEVPVDVAELARLVEDAAAGAVVTFGGVVRNHDGGQAVERIVYSAHPGAGDVVAAIAKDIAGRYPLDAIAVVHRVGALEVGDVALGAAVSGAHRQEAFAACAELVEEIKRRLPVWKKQEFPDGSHEWTGSA